MEEYFTFYKNDLLKLKNEISRNNLESNQLVFDLYRLDEVERNHILKEVT